MAKKTVLVCDECNSMEDVKHYEVREGLRRASLDLCGEHNKAVEELLTNAQAASQRARTIRSRPRQATTLEEIEALKRA